VVLRFVCLENCLRKNGYINSIQSLGSRWVIFLLATLLHPYAEANPAVLEGGREAAAHTCELTFWNAQGCFCYSA